MSSQPQRGFTLIELLAVIAIIGILGGIILTAIGPVRERMNAQKCMSQMRQLGQATLLYQASNNGYLPPNNAYSGSSAEDTWTMVLRPYLDVVDDKTYGAGTKLMTEYLTCPSVEDAMKPTKWWESSYAAGLCFGTDGTPRRTLSQDSSKTVMFIENTKPSTRSLAITPPPWDSVGYRHSEQANCVYLDGHVEQLTKEEVPQSMTDVFWGLQN